MNIFFVWFLFPPTLFISLCFLQEISSMYVFNILPSSQHTHTHTSIHLFSWFEKKVWDVGTSHAIQRTLWQWHLGSSHQLVRQPWSTSRLGVVLRVGLVRRRPNGLDTKGVNRLDATCLGNLDFVRFFVVEGFWGFSENNNDDNDSDDDNDNNGKSPWNNHHLRNMFGKQVQTS